MNTFLLIIKILPWALSLGGGIYGFFKRMKVKSLKETIKIKEGSIGKLKDIVLSQGEDLDKKTKIINELITIQKKYENKKVKITGARSATKIMEELNGDI